MRLRHLFFGATFGFTLLFASGCPSECGELGSPCCEGACSGANTVCDLGTSTCVADEGTTTPTCGAPTQQCCAGRVCQSGYTCDNTGRCERTPPPCGALNQVCCNAARQCDESSHICTSNRCVEPSCGFPGAACCTSGDACRSGLECQGGSCMTSAGACGAVGQACCAGNSCTSGTCCGGSCVDTQSNARNCGSCGRDCEGGACNGGSCAAACGGRGQTCCSSGSPCTPGTECQGGTCSPPATGCALAREDCVAGCCEGLDCSNVYYEDDAENPLFRSGCCAARNAACARDLDCCGWMECDEDAGVCVPQIAGSQCEGPNECDGGLLCIAGACQTGEPPPPECNATECGACTTSAGCGFCKDSNSCLAGSNIGPSGSVCVDWASEPAECVDPPDNCEALAMDCNGCIFPLDSNCGWCTSTNTCMAAGSGGSEDGTCTGTDFIDTAAFCPPPPGSECRGVSSCETCTDIPTCGWCGDSGGFCAPGDALNPSVGTCEDWDFGGFECIADPPDPCASAMGCDDCTSRGSCGWCEASNTCLTGTATGSNVGMCTGDDWDWLGERCTS